MAIISTFINPNNLISENINDAYKTIELVGSNIALIQTVANEIEAGQLPPGAYSIAQADAKFALIANTYTVGQADSKFALINNFNSTGINDDASSVIFTLTSDHNFIIGEGAFPTSWDDGSFAVQFAPFGAIYSYQGPIEDSHFNLTHNVHTYGVFEQRMAKGEASSYRQYRGHHYFRSAQAATPEAATALIQGKEYIIESIGTTDFTLVGASSNAVGEKFFATGAGTGTGTASQTQITWTTGISIFNTGRVSIPLLNFTDTVALFNSNDMNAALNEVFTILADPEVAYPQSGASLIGFNDQYSFFLPGTDTVQSAMTEMWFRLRDDALGYNESGAAIIGMQDSAAIVGFYGPKIGPYQRTVQETFEALPAVLSSTAPNKGASKIGIEDPTAALAATNVEDALDEIIHKTFGHGYHKITGSSTIVLDHHGHIIHVENTAPGTINVSLPELTTVPAGFYFLLDVKHAAGLVNLLPVGLDEIDEVAGTKALKNGDFLFIQSNGTEWETSAVGNRLNATYAYGSLITDSNCVDLGGGVTEVTLPIDGNAFTFQAPSFGRIDQIVGFGGGLSKITIHFGQVINLIHSTNLNLPGEANIIAQVGDVVEFVQLVSGRWWVTNFQQNVPPSGAQYPGHTVQTILKQNADLFSVGPLTIQTKMPLTTAPTQSGPNAPGVVWESESITPSKAGNRIIVELQISCTLTTQAASLVVALFQGNTNNAVAAAIRTEQISNHMGDLRLIYEDTAPNTNTITFWIRVGATHENSIMYINGDGANGEHFAGIASGSFIKITEIET